MFMSDLIFVSDYVGKGFVLVQSLLGLAMTQEWMSDSNITFDLQLRRMPYPPYVEDPMVAILQNQLPLFLVLSFILSVVQNTKSIVYEKERKLKV